MTKEYNILIEQENAKILCNVNSLYNLTMNDINAWYVKWVLLYIINDMGWVSRVNLSKRLKR